MAHSLKRAADLLTVTFESSVTDAVEAPVHGQFMLLAGFALENLVKGILIGRGSTKIQAGKLARWGGSGHDLIDLLNDAQISLDQDEQEFVERASVFALWAGRYPIPVYYKDKMPRTLRSGGFAMQSYTSNTDPALFQQIFGKLTTILESERGASIL